MRGQCREYDRTDAIEAVLLRRGGSTVEVSAPRRCGQPGEGVSLPCPAGRPDAEAGPYCETHGGRERAQREAERDWNYVAPASVGDAEAVQTAGCMCLDTRCAYLVVRHELPGGDRRVGTWLTWLGLGSRMQPVPVPGSAREIAVGEQSPADVPHRKHGESMRAWRRRCATVGRMAFDSREAALAAGIAAWRAHVDTVVAEILAARGGTLDWGVPVEPLTEPIIVEPGPGQSAWDVAITIPRRGQLGIATMSGLRPSGEAP